VRAVLHQKRELERQVVERTREIEKLFEQTKELAIVEERNRLARELHDSAKQKAFAALAQLGTANGLLQRDPNMARAHVREAENLVHDVIQELAFLIQEMYPLALQEKGLATTLREYVFEWENRTDVRVNINVENEARLPLHVEQAIYRIAQEALANVARHSHASRVEINLVFTESRATLTITDNGQGFDVTQRPKGVGLRSIRERAESINGRVGIESAPGKGTRLEIVISL
jgi:NarL family two-component system sensor histidine kinase LiaS